MSAAWRRVLCPLPEELMMGFTTQGRPISSMARSNSARVAAKRYGDVANIRPGKVGPGYLQKKPWDHLRTGILSGIAAAGVPTAKVLDSSPYDRLMRKFHNYMKDTPEFQQEEQGHEEFRFPPYSAWMVFTDMVSHASLSGQFAFVHTSIVRLANCRLPEMAPYNILRRSASATSA